MEKQDFETKWNWGAFINPIGFGFGNRAYLCLFALVPLLNIIWVFISGAKAKTWALANPANEYRDEQEFRKVMDTWKRAGFVQFIIILAICILYLILLALFGTLVFSNFTD